MPYYVYKRCPQLLRFLWKLIKIIWRRGKIVEYWKYSEGIWIPKEEGARKIDEFRYISLLNTEGIFFRILNKGLISFLQNNNHIDTSVQKRGVPGIPGCMENTGVISQLLKEAKTNKGNLAVLWLDLKNVYWSIPNRLVELTVKCYHVPDRISDLVLDYHNAFKMRIITKGWILAWHNLERGIITGCTTLFTLAMNLLIKTRIVM